MSGRKHFKAELLGYNSPIFPEGIQALNSAVDRAFINQIILADIGRSIKGFRRLNTDVRTQDSYFWFAGLEFNISGEKQILVAIPWQQDWDKKSRLQLDRSIAFYPRGVMITVEVASLLEKLIIAVKKS